MADLRARAVRESTDPPGYERLMYIDPTVGRCSPHSSNSIYVPAELANDLNHHRLQLESKVGSRAAWERACVVPAFPASEELDQPATSRANSASSDEVPSLDASAVPAHVISLAAMLAGAEPSGSPKPRPRPPKGTEVRVVFSEDVLRRQQTIKQNSRLTVTERRTELAILDELLARGELRWAAMKRDWRVRLAELRADMPNFTRVIARIEGYCALAAVGRTPLKIPPILLAGPPGVGKTHFAMRLADVLGVSQFVYALESAETTSTLTGSDKHWSNSEPGELFRLIVQGSIANPVVVLDEIDKVRSAGTSYQPANALHALLEPMTAACVRDKSADIRFDASHVTYIATANRLSTIAPSLLSRMELFYVEGPDARASVSIARAIARQTLQALSLRGRFEQPGGEVIQQMALLSGPRQMHKVFKAALGAAMIAGRTRVTVDDLSVCHRLPLEGGSGHDHEALH